MDLSSRSYQKELLDRDDIPFDAIERNMRELDIINTWLGGHRITLDGLKYLLQNRKKIIICEVGCGGGDNLVAIEKWCKKKNICAEFIGIDINPHCIAVAKSKFKDSNSRFIASDFRLVEFKQEKTDIIFSSLFCHHFTNDELISMLGWMQNNSTVGFFINDLHRHVLAYYSISLLTRIFSRSWLVRHDAPLSVLRGFIRKEWMSLLEQAGIPSKSIEWKWAFRWLIIIKNPA
jgi:2-polyprenyl-3-methyl-5-hydroxy-6-metoxy-1,4-benzoquinol methylase